MISPDDAFRTLSSIRSGPVRLEWLRQNLPVCSAGLLTLERMLVVIRGELRWAVVLCVACFAGCNGPQQRFFAWCQRDLRTEARTYEFHDPYPDEVAGPDTMTRPRTFEEPRSDTRRDFDLRLLLSLAGETNGPVLSRQSRGGQFVSPISPAVPMQPYATSPLPLGPTAGPVAAQPTLQLSPLE